MILKLVIVQFDFARLQYLYNSFLVLVLIIAVAAFQPEIRRMLIRIGQAGSFSRLRPSAAFANRRRNYRSSCKPFRKKRRSDYCLERQVALGEFIETGVRLDTPVKAALLKTIFHPGTALHDLAVVIHGDRIIAASVQLPLAELGSLRRSAWLETQSRHRDFARKRCGCHSRQRRNRHHKHSAGRQTRQTYEQRTTTSEIIRDYHWTRQQAAEKIF